MNESKLVKMLAKASNKRGDFPTNDNYYERFRRIEAYLNDKVHRHTAEGAMAEQLSELRRLIEAGKPEAELREAVLKNNAWLTNHGPEHVSTVIDRASALIIETECRIEPYEIYILLVAIHLHDVGNLYGRKGHETRITDVVASMDASLIGENAFEHRLIRDIAASHGGDANGDKNTIGQLPYSTDTVERGVRPHFLAALLRFADELADDHNRVARIALREDVMLKASEAFHAYADRLRSVAVEKNRIMFNFELDVESATRKYGKGGGEVYLLDEIFERTMKTHLEHLYCSRFMQPFVHIKRLEVTIGIFRRRFLENVCKISYVLEETGYPKQTTDRVHGIAVSGAAKPGGEKPFDSQSLNGEKLKEIIEALNPEEK